MKLVAKDNWYQTALAHLLIKEQFIYHGQEMEFFCNTSKACDKTPHLVESFNLYLDAGGFLRIRSKFREKKYHSILLPKLSPLTRLIVRDAHERIGHGGIYSTLRELKKEYHIPCFFSIVKKVLEGVVLHD